MLCFKHAAIQMIEQGTGGRLIGAGDLTHGAHFLVLTSLVYQGLALSQGNKVCSLRVPAHLANTTQ